VDGDAIILIIDDKTANIFALEKLLERPERFFLDATNGEDGLKIALANKIDLVILDVQMPGMDGFEACARIRKTVRDAATPIIFLTGHGDMQSRAYASKAGGSGFIVKPVTQSEIRLTALTFVLRSRMNKINNALAFDPGTPVSQPA
jgi:CheY-like chemotaxis protein